MFQSWQQLLFCHWKVAPRLRPLVPRALTLDSFACDAWLGLTPFRIAGLRARGLPPIPGTSDFLELNLRTYVTFGGKPGIYFFTLDAANRLAVLGARLLYRLPYRHAHMSIQHKAGWIEYQSRRADGAAFRAQYRPAAPPREASGASLEYFLTERYALYTVLHAGSVLGGDIHHAPRPLQAAEARIELNTLPAAHGIAVNGAAPLCHFSAVQDTLLWLPRKSADRRTICIALTENHYPGGAYAERPVGRGQCSTWHR